MSRTPNPNIDYTSRDYEAFRDLMIQKLQEVMPEYTDTSETDAGIVILEALANGLDILSLYLDAIANDILLPTTQDRKIAVILARCLGYTPYNQTASEYQQVFVLNKVRQEDTIIPKGTVVTTKKSTDLATLYFETMENYIIPKGALGNEQDENGKYLYTVRVQNGSSIYQDIIGTSNGTPLQSFSLSYTNVLVDSIEIYVNEGNGQEIWRRVDNFIECDENSRVYTVTVDDFDVCNIEFGNGFRGRIPSAYPSGIVANYRVGGGEVSNVSSGIITEIESSIAYLESTFNLEAQVRGHDKESLESIKENAPASYRVRDRIVALDDYSDILRINFYDFLSLKTIRDENDKKMVHIYYMMRPEYEMTPKLVEDIAEFISRRSMIGTTYDLNPYIPQPIDLDCVMYVNKDYDGESLKSDVLAYLDSVTFCYGELIFEESIVKSDLENEIKSTFNGVLSFRINEPTHDIISPNSEENVLTKGTINIEVRYL